MSSDPNTLVPGADIAIRTEGLCKRYQIYNSPLDRLKHILSPRSDKYHTQFQALDDINLTIRRGETCAIVGRNGSGKSTLLQILCGTLRGTSGQVEINGRVAALLELGAGFNTDFTGRENVYMNGAILGLSRDEMDAAFPAIEAFAEIGDFIDQPVKTYSSGMYVRLAFSVAIHVDPQILIVDEALAVGDSRFQAKCMNRIKAMQAEGVTILFVSHDVGAVRTLCERALWLEQGRVRMLGDALSVTAHYNQFLFESDDAERRPETTTSPEPSTAACTEATGGAPSDATAPGPGSAASALAPDALMTPPPPINHWGTHIGAILDAGIFNLRGERAASFAALEDLEIRVTLKIPEMADRSTLSVAVSLKDLRGTDLIVSTTKDQSTVDFTQTGSTVRARFQLKNRLNAGNYLLAVALEDRAGVIPQYYEYIEGAQYFSSLAECKLYGVFIADVQQVVDILNN